MLHLTDNVKYGINSFLNSPLPKIQEKVYITTVSCNGETLQTQMDFLVTWNCTHIANAAMRVMIEAVCRSLGYEPPVICTPEELMEE